MATWLSLRTLRCAAYNNSLTKKSHYVSTYQTNKRAHNTTYSMLLLLKCLQLLSSWALDWTRIVISWAKAIDLATSLVLSHSWHRWGHSLSRSTALKRDVRWKGRTTRALYCPISSGWSLNLKWKPLSPWYTVLHDVLNDFRYLESTVGKHGTSLRDIPTGTPKTLTIIFLTDMVTTSSKSKLGPSKSQILALSTH